jgi:hypothetical protein
MRKGTKMSSDICVQLRERGEHVAAEFIERLSKRFVDEERKCLILERSYSQQQKVWSDAIARADRYEAALRYYAKEYENPFGGDDSLVARAALGEKKDGNV